MTDRIERAKQAAAVVAKAHRLTTPTAEHMVDRAIRMGHTPEQGVAMVVRWAEACDAFRAAQITQSEAHQLVRTSRITTEETR